MNGLADSVVHQYVWWYTVELIGNQTKEQLTAISEQITLTFNMFQLEATQAAIYEIDQPDQFHAQSPFHFMFVL